MSDEHTPETPGFPHPSRPGHYGLTLTDHTRDGLAQLLAALIPGDGVYPSAADAQVVRFVEERCSPQDVERLGAIVDRCASGTPVEADAALRRLESDDPDDFAWLRDFAYHGYYASRRVLAVMSDVGYAYHGAPQPLGYVIADEMAVPTVRRGRYIPTEEVSRVSD